MRLRGLIAYRLHDQNWPAFVHVGERRVRPAPAAPFGSGRQYGMPGVTGINEASNRVVLAVSSTMVCNYCGIRLGHIRGPY